MNKIIIKKLKRFLFIFVFFLFFTQQNCIAGKNEKGGGDSGKSSTTGKKSSNSESCSSTSGKTTNSTDCDAALSSAATNSSVFSWGGMPNVTPNTEIGNYRGGNSFEISLRNSEIYLIRRCKVSVTVFLFAMTVFLYFN